jgi:hypothetical protein
MNNLDSATVLVLNKKENEAIEILEKKIVHLESVFVDAKPYWLVIGILKDLIIELKEKK